MSVKFNQSVMGTKTPIPHFMAVAFDPDLFEIDSPYFREIKESVY